jgi:hypothetical protein
LYWRQQNISHWGTKLKKLDDESRCEFWWGKVVCFVLSCWDLPNHDTSCCTLHIFLKLSMSRGAPTWFETVWSYSVEVIDYWIISFCEWKLNKTETENCIGIWSCSWCCWKAFSESDLIEFISQFSELRCERYWIVSGFCCWKFKQSSEIGLGRKNQLSPQCFEIHKFLILKMWKIKNVFTRGSMYMKRWLKAMGLTFSSNLQELKTPIVNLKSDHGLMKVNLLIYQEWHPFAQHIW